MNEQSKVWLHTNDEKLQSILADEAKEAQMLNSITHTLKQLQAKNTFRIALLNQIIESKENK